MKTYFARVWTLSFLLLLTLRAITSAATWTGAGGDDFWSTPANWGGTALSAGDALLFGGSTRTSPNNDFPAGTTFERVQILSPAGAFTLRGNGIALLSGIGDDQPLVPQVIQFPIVFQNASARITVAQDGSLTLSGVVSGSGITLTKNGDGQLTLSAVNSFDGSLILESGTLAVSADRNLGLPPASPTAGSIIFDEGALRATASFTLNANRGITIAPIEGAGAGKITVNSGSTLTYGGVIANNGGAGSLTKNAFGTLTLSGANTYNGRTILQNGTIILDFTAASAPANNIIASSSGLTLGGESAGLGTISYAALTLNGKSGGNSSQTFADTTVDIGPAIIRANSGAGGSANLLLGALGHNPGAAAALVPPAATGGSGNITTPSANINGILGGWAIYSDGSAPVGNVTVGQNWASVNGSGNIVAYNGYADYSSGNLHGAVPSSANLRLTAGSHPGGAAIAVRVDAESAGTLTDVNSLAIGTVVSGDTIVIGTGNTLRLGRYGGIFRQDNTTANVTWYIGGSSGPQTGTGTAGSQGIGTLTAGGADNTDGEIVFTINAPNQTQGSCVVEPTITDNGSGKVTVVKTGPGSMKLDGHNTFSGGLYILQGRLQFAGSEVGGPNPDGGGTGPIYVGPGGQFFPSGAATGTIPGAITNELFLAGLGGGAFSSGALRLSTSPQALAGQVNLIGDVFVCGGGSGNTNGQITGKITGNFSFGVGQSGGGENIVTYFRILNQNNDYSGDTVVSVRNGGTPASTLVLGNSDVIPDGIGKGNVVLRPGSGAAATLDMFGFSETINGLTTGGSGSLANAIVQNSAPATVATLTVGNYDATATFGGIIKDNGGTMALTKIGGGKQTLTGVNAYTGVTTISNGTLAITGSGSIASSSQIIIDGLLNANPTLDVSEVTSGFTYGSSINITNGVLVIRNTASPGITALNLSDARIRVMGLGSVPVVAEVTSLSTGDESNKIDIGSIGTVSSYPATFTIIKYGGSIGGAGFTFELGNVPTPSTTGYVTNNEANSSIDLVLLDGPKPLTWTGLLGSAWDIDNTVNWRAFGITPSVYLDVDSVFFQDGGATSFIDLTTTLKPGAVVVSNALQTYTFGGLGSISGPAGLTKESDGTLVLANAGTNDFFGPLTVRGGTVQVGNGGTTGNLSGGNVINNAQLAFNRSDDITVGNPISGSGILQQNGPGTLTVSGDNTFTGRVVVAQGTLKPGRGNAFGTVDGNTTVEPGGALDVNGQNLGGEPVVAAGEGVNGNGAIVNSGADQISALRDVTLANDTTFGGTTRWDIRNTGGTARLSTGGNAFKLTKRGPNAISLVNVGVDSALGDVDVVEGTLRLQDATSGLGDTFNTLTVFSGATLAFFNLNPNPLDKQIVLQDGATIMHESGRSLLNAAITLGGSNVFNIANSGTNPSLVLSNLLDGDGSLNKMGGGPMIIAGAARHTGPTRVNAGTLVVDGSIDLSEVTVSGGTLSGIGSVFTSTLIATNGRLSPGNTTSAAAVIIFEGQLTLRGTTAMDINKAGGAISGDAVQGFPTISYGGTLQLTLTGEALAAGDELHLFTFASASGAFASIVPATPAAGLVWDTSSLTTDGILKVANPSQSDFGSISISGSDVVLEGTGGPPNAQYRVLSSTDLTVPVVNWQPVATNSYDASGNFNFRLPIEPTTPARFFILSH